MGREAVAGRFFSDFLENLGDNSKEDGGRITEEANFILADWFFTGLLEIRWDPKRHKLILKRDKESK